VDSTPSPTVKKPLTPAAPASGAADQNGRFFMLALGALGVVYGDIGTSPLYTLKICLQATGKTSIEPADILGLLSLMIWSLVLMVTIKYVTVILRLDNRGEGGILALLALTQRQETRRFRYGQIALFAGLLGSAFFFADAAITPAISVLSAVEGLEVAVPGFAPLVIPLAIAILTMLFAFQRRGTAKVGALFGPIMIVWFLILGGLGLYWIVQMPQVLWALDPRYGVAFAFNNGWAGLLVLGSVVLVFTGTEALYADMGHFGRRPIKVAWLFFVFPCLTLNYMGQGALTLYAPEAAKNPDFNPFYLLAPEWGRMTLVLLATVATVIASQAVISGAYSLARQAIQLGFLPRLQIHHTSETEHGQIYIPRVNWLMYAAVLMLVGIFHSSTALGDAYGVAVTGAMLTTSLIAFILFLNRRGRPALHPVYIFGPFIVIDTFFFLVTATKVGTGGGIVPLMMGLLLFFCMSTWKLGRAELVRRQRASLVPLEDFIRSMSRSSAPRVEGTAVFLSGTADLVPHALLHNLKHNKVLHKRIVLLTINTENVPHVPLGRRAGVEDLGEGFFRLTGHFGFMDQPDVNSLLRLAAPKGLETSPMETSFFVGRDTLVPAPHSKLARWREQLFIMLAGSAQSAAGYFHLPSDRVVELGAQVEI
jgi:KUP system potassium uptake protein